MSSILEKATAAAQTAAQAATSIGGKAVDLTMGNSKKRQLDAVTVDPIGEKAILTEYTGRKIENHDISLKAGERGPVLLEDDTLRSKISAFDHERIPERVIHARGAAAHGTFKLHTAIPHLTNAKILNDTKGETPIFLRFSTVAGSRGSADSVRDVRGFALRFYTQEGNWDIVGNNIPIFFVQDAMKFPDFIHAVKPEPHNEIPQAQSAHDNTFDFLGLQTEGMHMLMWHLSDRTIPRSFRHIQGFGVHSFIFTNDAGERHFVKFHMTPKLGVHGLVWDESLKLAGNDPDSQRRDLYENIEAGSYPEWDFGVQVVPEADEHKFDFDLLDSTKIIPEDLVPVQNIGTFQLNRNVTEYFTETEQVAFCTSHIVPGISHSNDPLLAGRNFSYFDTQISRLGVNWTDLPINRPVCPMFNNTRDGQGRHRITKGTVNYSPNRFEHPHPVPESEGGYVHAATPVAGPKVRHRSEKMKEHFNQATYFWNSMSDVEKDHIVSAFQFELGKVEDEEIQKLTVKNINRVDHTLAVRVAEAFSFDAPPEFAPNHGKRSEYLSMITGKNQVFTAEGRKIAIYVFDGYDSASFRAVQLAITAAKATFMVVGPRSGTVKGSAGDYTNTQFTLETCRSTFFDAGVFIGGEGEKYAKDLKQGRAVHAVREYYMHQKAIAATGSAVSWLNTMCLPGELAQGSSVGSGVVVDTGVILTEAVAGPEFCSKLIGEVAKHRCWAREVAHIAA